ncbi:phage virion morphogenesis protein [Cereibacter sphaeroides WS8N]|uniref:phage virion morphogenesis protein n=1 Tax=Cereibacter sphaeroides TaxID=1063 RepID=UPI00020B0333|nr:phage virion morphogenesis protein [Cereibacter sphaeroides]EGJ20114.1 phage virion morphogenesis protein [Cereibacter sphaeroides WS8N]
MVGVVVETDASVASAALGRLGDEQLALVMYEVGALIEDQTKLRLADEKTSPEGAAWAPWSAAYDESRNHRKHSLLVAEGDLRDSVQNVTTGTEAVVGSNLVYAAHHQFGTDPSKRRAGVPDGAAGAGIPARPWLGLSADNRADIEALVAGRLEDLLQ